MLLLCFFFSEGGEDGAFFWGELEGVGDGVFAVEFFYKFCGGVGEVNKEIEVESGSEPVFACLFCFCLAGAEDVGVTFVDEVITEDDAGEVSIC